MQQSRLDKEHMPKAGEISRNAKDIFSTCFWYKVTFTQRGNLLCANTDIFFSDPSGENILEEAG